MGNIPEFELETSNSIEAQLDFSRYELAHLAEHASKGSLDTYGATPMDHQSAFDQQCDLLDGLRTLVEEDIPEGIPDRIRDYVRDTFEVRFHKRGTANFENFISALNEDVPKQFSIALDRARMGHASPAELLLIREYMGIRSAELACLTHPYGKRIEYLDEMRDAVRQSVELLGGTYYEDTQTRFRVKGTVGAVYDDPRAVSEGFFMTRKRNLGIMPDGTVIRERTSFVLRTEYNGATFVDLNSISKLDPTSDTWQDDVVSAGQLDIIANDLMEADQYSLAVPISTTIYAFNEKTAQAIAERDEANRAERCAQSREDIRLNYPSLHAAINEGRSRRAENEIAPEGAVDIDGMLYIGPSLNK